MLDFFADHWEAIVSVSALVVASLSSFVSFLTFKQQRTHDMKSVVPIIQVGQWDYENMIQVDMRNSGLGPALIKNIAVVDNSGECRASLFAWLPKNLPSEMNYAEYWTAYQNFVVQPSQIIYLIKIPVDTELPRQVDERERLRAILRQLTVRIEYEDLYHNRISPKVMQLYHFARTDHQN